MKMNNASLSHARELAIASEMTQNLDSTLARLNTQQDGLTMEDAAERLLEYGKNQVARDRKSVV